MVAEARTAAEAAVAVAAALAAPRMEPRGQIETAAAALTAPRLEPHGEIIAASVAAAALAAPQVVAPHGRIEAPVAAPAAAAIRYDNTSTTVTRMDATPLMAARTVPDMHAIPDRPGTQPTRKRLRSTI